MLQLDGTGPLHQQVYRAFRNEILGGGWRRANGFLPPATLRTF